MQLLAYFPVELRRILESVPEKAPLTEICVRLGQPVQLCFSGGEKLWGSYLATKEDCAGILSRITEQSLYAREAELRGGYVALPGGCRVGVCGRGILRDGALYGMGEARSFCFRIPRAAAGAAEAVAALLRDGNGRPYPTLIVSPPGCGKTTLLRDIARACSYGLYGFFPCKVAVADTRYELAGCGDGPGLDLGPRTDVLSGVPKEEAMRMLMMNMAPDVLVTDEVATFGEAAAVADAAACGIRVLTSVHASCAKELLARRGAAMLLRDGMFQRTVLLSRSRGPGTVEGVFDQDMHGMLTGGSLCAGS